MKKNKVNPTYKHDFEEAKERMLKWWNREYFGRCAITVYAPKTDLSEAFEDLELPQDPTQKFCDIEYVRKFNEYNLASTFFGGEAIPVWGPPAFPGLSQASAYYGDGEQIKLNMETAWREEVISSGPLTDYSEKDIAYDPENKWLIRALKLQKASVEYSYHESIPAILTYINPGDDLADMRGANNLLYDLVDCPEHVKKLDNFLIDQGMKLYDMFFDIIKEKYDGNSGWFRIWGPGKFGVLNNDLSYMISPKMFEEIFLDGIKRLAKFYDYPLYHVDGIGSFNHIENLCQIKEIRAYQIVPGAGKPSPLHYIDVLKKVQSYGKNLHITIAPQEVESALELLSAKGLMIDTYCDTQEEAETLIAICEKNSKE